MRLRSGSSEPDGFRVNGFPLDTSTDNSAGGGGRGRGIRGKIQRLLWGNRSPTSNIPSANDGSPEEQPEESFTFKDYLEMRHFSEASQILIDQENLLYMDSSETVPLQDWESEVEQLQNDYETLTAAILETVRLSLNMTEMGSQALASAASAICQEDVQDNAWMDRKQQKPKWRPSNLTQKHDDVLKSLVENRMDNPTVERQPGVGPGSSIQNDVCFMGRQMKQDVGTVLELVNECYPEEMDICKVYVCLYHQTLGSRMRKIADFGLDDKDCEFLLRWVNEYYPQILHELMLPVHISYDALGNLLPQEYLEPLEEQYLTKHQMDMSSYINKVLIEAKQMWIEGESPKTEDGCFVSDTAFHIIQFINGAVIAAETVLADHLKAERLTRHLQDLLHSYKKFQDEVIKANKSNTGPVVKANLFCIQQFSNVLVTKSCLFPDDVREGCLSILTKMQQSAQYYLLSPLHADLKALYRKLSSDWFKGSQFNKLLENIESKSQDLQGLAGAAHQEVMGQFHLEVTAEYVKRLLKGEVKLKDQNKQQEAYATVKKDAESLYNTFYKMGSRSDWVKDVLIRIAELFELQDLAAIQMHVASMGATYPDISEKHISAILKLKTNFSKTNRHTVKLTLRDALTEAPAENTHTFFSLIRL